jgi:hypothetical protein
MSSFCQNIPVIPQNLGTCWFNAILMAMIYSDGLSQIIYEKAIEDNWHLDEKGAFKTIMLLFMNYVRAIKKSGNYILIERFREFINKYKIELILLDYLTYYHPELLKYFYEYINKGISSNYFLFILLKSLKLNIASVTLFTDTDGTSKRYNIDIQYEYDTRNKLIPKKFTGIIPDIIPDILICKTKKNLPLSISLGYPSFTQIKDFGKEIMVFKRQRFKLDCILLSDKTNTHIITGLTCYGSKYVYNGWWKIKGNPCNLMEFDWNTDIRNFCLDLTNCKLPDYNPEDDNEDNYCFNFKQNNCILIYVRIKEDNVVSKKQVKKINRIDIYNHINDYNEEQIKDILVNFYEFKDKTLNRLDINELRNLLREELRKELDENYQSIEHYDELSSIVSDISLDIFIINTIKKLKKNKNPDEIEILKNQLNKLIKEKFSDEFLRNINTSLKIDLKSKKELLDFIKAIYEKKKRQKTSDNIHLIPKKIKTSETK